MVINSPILETNAILTNLFKDERLDRCCKTFCPNSYDDLKQDAFCILIEKGDLIIQLQQEKKLFHYTVSVIRNLARTRNRKIPPSELPELPSLSDVIEPDDLEDKALEVFNQLEETFGTPEYKGMIEMVIKCGGSRRAAARALMLPRMTVHRGMEKMREHFKNKLCPVLLYTCFFALALPG